SVQLMQELGKAVGVDFFDRMQVAYRSVEEIRTAPMHAFADLVKEGQLDAETIVFNNLVKTKGEFEAQWEVPASASWHAQLIA
ncbi:MAG: ABC transporter ATPase, partial [Chloroflexota bacterium]